MSKESSQPNVADWRLTQERYRLAGKTCPHCGVVQFPPREICPNCQPSVEKFMFNQPEKNESADLKLADSQVGMVCLALIQSV